MYYNPRDFGDSIYDLIKIIDDNQYDFKKCSRIMDDIYHKLETNRSIMPPNLKLDDSIKPEMLRGYEVMWFTKLLYEHEIFRPTCFTGIKDVEFCIDRIERCIITGLYTIFTREWFEVELEIAKEDLHKQLKWWDELDERHYIPISNDMYEMKVDYLTKLRERISL